ncbi:CD63 antigen-like isoform X2 [Lytechinus pictus]|uniref:CD63 antigen-like isoform X2 n=1 Tax=Lytechinus pictus TaxID=7653 RepID=UPI00240DA072|nr:CD63 antigen-like isoform X2 [Lytechinus pictus]
MEGSAKCIKYLMFFFNFIFFIFGLGIIIGGSLTLTLYSEYVDFTGNTGTAIPIALICIGVFIFLTGFFGCCGAVKENYCMLATFAFIMVLLLILELAAGISGYVKRDDIDNLIDDNMSELQQTYNESESTKDLFDNMQKNLECCGSDNYTDWLGYNASNPNMVPQSCCKSPSVSNCNVPGSTNFDIYTEACYPALKDLLIGNIGIIAGVAIAIAVIEIFGIAFACCLMRYVSGPYVVVVQSSNQGT